MGELIISETLKRIEKQYLEVRKRTLQLCAPLGVEDYLQQPVEFVSPVKWHIAHTTWFFEEFVLSNNKEYTRFNKDFAYLFNSYYNGVGVRLARNKRATLTRPLVEKVLEFRHYVDAAILRLFQDNPSIEQLKLIELGLQHEQQHQELLLTDLKYSLSLNPIKPVYHQDFNLVASVEEKHEDVELEGLYDIGYKGQDFCFDNELAAHRSFVEPCKIAGNLVKNGEYLEFVLDRAYQEHRLWLDEGWYEIQENKQSHPLYWTKLDGEWFQYTLSGLIPLDLNAVATHLSYYEAQAFASWKNMRLPTEFEWEAASDQLHWGKAWEWTQSAYLPYPNFKTAKGAVGEYNGKFMVNQMVLRGASLATAPKHSRKTYRNFFHPKYQWQFSGIRLASNI